MPTNRSVRGATRSARRPAGNALAEYTTFIATSTSGAYAVARPTSLARRMRKASLKRARVSAAPAAVTAQKAPPSARIVCRSKRGAPLGAFACSLRIGILHAEGHQQERQDRRHHGDPEHRAEVVAPREHERHRDERPGDGADRVERLAQPEGGPADLLGREVGDERIARRAADALADAVEEARGEHEERTGREGEERLGERRQPVAERGDPLALAQAIGERPREHLHDERGGLRDAFDHAHRERARAEAHGEVERQRLWIISEEMSISRLTKPSTQTPRGMAEADFTGMFVFSRRVALTPAYVLSHQFRRMRAPSLRAQPR